MLLGGILTRRWPKMAPRYPQEAPGWRMMEPETFLEPDWDRGEVQVRLGVVGVFCRVAHIFNDS